MKKIDNNIIKLLHDYPPRDRQEFLNDVDKVICDIYDFKYEDLPWRNPNIRDVSWDKLMEKIRLAMIRICIQFGKKDRTIH